MDGLQIFTYQKPFMGWHSFFFIDSMVLTKYWNYLIYRLRPSTTWTLNPIKENVLLSRSGCFQLSQANYSMRTLQRSKEMKGLFKFYMTPE